MMFLAPPYRGFITTTPSPCSDKTGTLTSNDMAVVRLWAAGRQFRVVKETAADDTSVGGRHSRGHGHHSSNHDDSARARGSRFGAAGVRSDANLGVDGIGGQSGSQAPRRPLARLVPIPDPSPGSSISGSATATSSSDTPPSASSSSSSSPRSSWWREPGESWADGGLPLPPAVRSLLVQGLVVNSTASIRKMHGSGGGRNGSGGGSAVTGGASGWDMMARALGGCVVGVNTAAERGCGRVKRDGGDAAPCPRKCRAAQRWAGPCPHN
jgi:hypothetical protein